MTPLTRARGRSLLATATTAFILAALVPASPAFAADEDPVIPVASISGVVTDPTGAPAPDACLAAEVLADGAWAPIDLGLEIRTDADGAYSVAGLGDGTYTISAASCTSPSDTQPTWAPSRSEQPEIVDGVVVADGTVVTDGVAAAAVDIQLLPAPIEVVDGPAISGDAEFGATLTADPGTWTVGGVDFPGLDFAYRWLRDGAEIADATGAAYVVTSEDLDASLSVTVTATRDGWEPASATTIGTAPIAALPITSSTPTITGTAKVGETLTAAAGGWSVAPALAWLRNGAPIAGATNPTYVLTAADLGKTVSVQATAALAGHTTATMTSASTAAVAIGTLVTAAPTVAGTAKVGSALTAMTGWTPGGITYTYVWKRNGTTITGATQATYTPAAADLGAKLTVTATGRLPGYSSVVRTSAPTAAVTVGTFAAPAPTLSGTVAVGRTVTAVPGTWKPGATFTYQWKRNGVSITGATKSTYAITATDLKTALTVTVTGQATAYTTRSTTSAPTTVAAGTLTAATPTIAGIRAVGRTLTAVPGTWAPSGVTLAYQWKRAGVSITGATASTYVLTAADLGKTLTVAVIGRKTAYTSAAKTSVATAAIVAGTITAATPTVAGIRAVGRALTAVPGTWAPSGVTLAYQWKRAGVSITGATKSTYVTTATDLGKPLTVTITGTKAGFTTVVKTSVNTAAIAAGTITYTPKLSGTQRAGSKLAVTVGTITPSGATVKYQWYRNGTAISGQTASTYALGNVDAGKVVSVTVTVSKTAFTTKASTLKTGTVAVRPASFTGDGWFRVGIDVQPGTYYTASSPSSCQWWRTSSADGSEASILGWDPGGTGRRMITILSTDRYVVFSGCGSWIRYDGTGTQSTTMAGDGIAVVGVNLRPGRYVSYGNSGCWAGDWNAPTGAEADLLAGGTYDGDIYWIVEPGIFWETYNCNTFTWYSY
ncbi:carboxypeptidase regulatory-like domain-containing protein [Agromyces salentinus]|uniref:Alpha-amylase n=1 Tax=Agromyces salentinus TaxID=269421 RepID=A0ABP4Z768_9MICO|nr:carboxypeptidase regulatory-like domain-containing protein [Agromyces salentinus]